MIEQMVLDSFTYSIMAISAAASLVIIYIAWSDEKIHRENKR